MSDYSMLHARLPGVWFYEKVTTDCLCIIITAGRTPMRVGEELYCEAHDRAATVTAVAPATLVQQDELMGIHQCLSQ